MSGIMMSLATNGIVSIPTPSLYLDAANYSGSGTTWTASVGNNATLVNTPTYTSASPTYFSFNPASAEEATLPAMSDMSTWSVEAWFRVTGSLTGQCTAIVTDEFDLTSKLNFSMGTNIFPTNSNICIGFYEGGWHTTNGFAPSTNTWYQCVGTYDGSTIRQYVNGVQNTSLSYSGTSESGGLSVRISRRWDGNTTSTNYFPGDVSIVRIWNGALTATEVKQTFNNLRSRYSI